MGWAIWEVYRSYLVMVWYFPEEELENPLEEYLHSVLNPLYSVTLQSCSTSSLSRCWITHQKSCSCRIWRSFSWAITVLYRSSRKFYRKVRWWLMIWRIPRCRSCFVFFFVTCTYYHVSYYSPSSNQSYPIPP